VLPNTATTVTGNVLVLIIDVAEAMACAMTPAALYGR
jgi:hypothetical protein